MSETRCKTCNDAREVWDGGIEAVKAAARVPCPDCAAPPPQEPGREEMVAWLNHQRYKNDGTPVNAAHNAMLDRIIAALASSPAPGVRVTEETRALRDRIVGWVMQVKGASVADVDRLAALSGSGATGGEGLGKDREVAPPDAGGDARTGFAAPQAQPLAAPRAGGSDV